MRMNHDDHTNETKSRQIFGLEKSAKSGVNCDFIQSYTTLLIKQWFGSACIECGSGSRSSLLAQCGSYSGSGFRSSILLNLNILHPKASVVKKFTSAWEFQ